MAASSSSWDRVAVLLLLWNSSIVREMTARPVSRAISSSMGPSDLDVDDLPDPEEAGELHHERDRNQNLADRVREQHRHVLRVDRVEDAEQHEREQGQQVAGHAALCRVDLDLPADGKARANDARKVVQDLGQVATDLALDQDRCYQDAYVHQADP